MITNLFKNVGAFLLLVGSIGLAGCQQTFEDDYKHRSIFNEINRKAGG